MCVCFQLAAAAEVIIRKDKENWDDEGGKTKDEKWRVGINLGGLRNNWEKKISGEIYHLFMFVENGFRNSHYYCLMKYITMVMNRYSGECFVLREHFIRTEHITIVDKVNPFQ